MSIVKDTNISTHVLDTSNGLPAGNLKVRLMKCTADDNDPRLLNPEEDLPFTEIGTTFTNSDGRARFEFDINIGLYKMIFYTAPYFQRNATTNFYPKVEIFFRLTEPQRHHHVPLLISPFGYSTYRGS